MEKKKKFNIFYLIILVILLIFSLAAYRNLTRHHEKEYLVINNKILESAKDCYLKKDCEDKITLKDLYEKKYLEVQYDPITKEKMDEELCIEFKDNEAIFCENE